MEVTGINIFLKTGLLTSFIVPTAPPPLDLPQMLKDHPDGEITKGEFILLQRFKLGSKMADASEYVELQEVSFYEFVSRKSLKMAARVDSSWIVDFSFYR